VPAFGQCADNTYCVFNEQYRWNGGINYNGNSTTVQPGDRIFAALQLTSGGYVMTIKTTGSVNTTTTDVRPPSTLEGQNFTNVYFVVEHHSNCNQLPPDNQIVYSNIRVFCNNNLQFTPTWTTAQGSNPICGAQAVVQSYSRIALTWNSGSKGPFGADLKPARPAHN
jgi:hypothetical protein